MTDRAQWPDRRRFLVCGGRDFVDYDLIVEKLMLYTLPGDTIIHGGCRGTDFMAGRFARENGRAEMVFSADWTGYGRSAGPLRNKRMLEEGRPHVVVAFPGGRGTADMVRQAIAAGVPVVEVTAP